MLVRVLVWPGVFVCSFGVWFFFSSRRRHTRCLSDWSSDVCSSDLVEVDVDEHTGWITVPKIWIAHDIGRALNPVLARGQVIGGIYMGLGEALMEEQVFRRLPPKLSNALVHKIPSLLEYKTIPSLDLPGVEVMLIEDPDPNCPFGAKEVGQGPLLPVMPAVANAVFDAVGVRIDEVPITPEKILRALHLKRE